MKTSGLTFEWDEKKARGNLAKHRISFENAASIFRDTNSITIFNELNSKVEDRYVTIGLSLFGQLLVVCHTDRHSRIRIISARKATSKERKEYEKRI